MRGEMNHLYYSPGPSLIDQFGSLNGWGAIGLSRAINSHVGGSGDVGVTGAELLLALPTMKSLRSAIASFKRRRTLDETLPVPRSLPKFKLNFNRKSGKTTVNRENADKMAKFLSGLYLGYQFGVAPTVESVINAIDAYNQFGRSLAKPPAWKKYRINLESTETESPFYVGTHNVPLGGISDLIESNKIRKSKIWFTCQLRDKSSLTPKMRRAINAGSIIDARSLYAVAPWSWFGDWFVPISKNLDNINMSNYVDIRMCAVMNSVEYQAHAVSEVQYPFDGETETKTVRSSHDVVMKRRTPFVPFGVAPTIPQLNLFRASIMGALVAVKS